MLANLSRGQSVEQDTLCTSVREMKVLEVSN